jgi:hypothetical protein
MQHRTPIILFFMAAALLLGLGACSTKSDDMVDPGIFAFAPYAQNETTLRRFGARMRRASNRSAIDNQLITEGGASAELAAGGHTYYIYRSAPIDGSRTPPWVFYVNAAYADNGDLQSLRYGVGYDNGFPSGPDLPPRTFDIFAWEAHGAGSGYGIYILQQQFNRIFPAGSSCQAADLYFGQIPEMGKTVLGGKTTYAAQSGLMKAKRACAVSFTCHNGQTLNAPPVVSCGHVSY